jgi:hypothetical protein
VGPTLTEGVDDVFGVRVVDAAVTEHGEAGSRRLKVAGGWAFGDEPGE